MDDRVQRLEDGSVDLLSGLVRRGDEELRLSSKEVGLLSYLAHRPGEVVSHDELLREVWGYAESVQSRAPAVTMTRLRKKIEADPANPRHLVTVVGEGYRFVPPAGEPAGITREALERRLAEWLGPEQEWAVVVTDRTRRTTNLGGETTRFIGRAKDLEAVESLLGGAARLVTVQGAAGLGKTRLARRIGARWREDHGGEVWFCDLADARTTQDALAVVARVIGLLQVPETVQALYERLVAVLGRRGDMLLILDNFEQLPTRAAVAVGRLVAEVSDLRVLVTSRERLGVSAERVHRLEPLSSPEAQALLRDRIEALGLDSGRRLDEACLRDIAAILEGVPLALEMAAARARILPLAELRDRLRTSFEALRLDGGDVPARQQTLRHAIEWSWRLLAEDEQRALVQLSVFRGGCDVVSAEQVLQVEGASLDVVGSLLDKSMLRIWQVDGVRRLRPYESVRQFALDRGAADVVERARAHHATWAVRHARRWHEVAYGDPEAIPALVREIDNFRAAIAWLLERERPGALDVLVALRHPVKARGIPPDYLDLLRRTRERLELSKRQGGRVHELVAMALGQAGRIMAARVEVERGLSGVADGDPLRGALLSGASQLEVDAGRFAAARALAEEGLALAGRHGWARHRPLLLNDLGRALHHEGRLDRAEAAYRGGIEAAQAVADDRRLASLWGNLGDLLGRRGDFDEAMDCLVRAGELAERVGDEASRHNNLATQALTLARQGEVRRADALYRDVLEQQERLGFRSVLAGNRTNAGIVALLVGEIARATELLEDARRELEAAGSSGSRAALCVAYLLACRGLSDEGDLEGLEHLAQELAAYDLEAATIDHRREIELCLGHLDVVRSRRARDAGDADAADRHRAAARKRLAEHGDAESTDVRYAAELLERALAAS